MKSVTCCVVSWQAKYSLSLMWESLLHYNPGFDFKLIVCDNGSTDGALEYAQRHASKVLLGNNSRNHGWGLTECVRRVETPYLLLMDNDCFFTKPGTLEMMFEHLSPNAFCVCPERQHTLGKGVPYGHNETMEWSPDVACSLFRTNVLQGLCKHFHLGYYGDLVSERVYETMGLVWRVAQTHGLDSVEPEWMWDHVRHVGHMSGLWRICPEYPDPVAIERARAANPEGMRVAIECYGRIKQDLAEIRGCSPYDLDAHEPASKGQSEVIDLNWTAPKGTHVKLISGAGIR